MKHLASLVLAAVAAAACLADGAKSPFARSLVSRMIEAREGSQAPIKRMWYAEPGKASGAVSWPFNVARVERLLEGGILTMDDGSMRLKRDASEPDSRKASGNAIAYANRVICEWAVMELDARFERCDAETTKKLGGYRAELDPDFWRNYAILSKAGASGGGSSKAGGWITAWKIEKTLYLVLTTDIGKETCPREYQFVMWNGKKDWPMVGFDSFPDAARFGMVRSLLESPAAANNLAAMIHSGEANRGAYMRDYVESLLRRAAAGGCDAAFHNLGVLMEEKGMKEEAEAFYTRERAGADGTVE